MSESKMVYSVEETLRIQTAKLNQQLNKLLEQNTQIIELTAERDSALANIAEHKRLHTELNAILHPNGDAPAAPSLCDLVSYVRSDLQRLSDERDARESECEALALKVSEVQDERDAALAQNAELVAHNSFLLGVLQSLGQSHLEDGETEAAESVLCHTRVTPTQCLRDVKAEAVREFSNQLILSINATDFNGKSVRSEFKSIAEICIQKIKECDQYAASVKAGEV